MVRFTRRKIVNSVGAAVAVPGAGRLSAANTTLRSIGHIARLQRVADNDERYVSPEDMLTELLEDNRQLAVSLRGAHALCDEGGDVAGASLIETWIDEAEHRTWFLHETTR